MPGGKRQKVDTPPNTQHQAPTTMSIVEHELLEFLKQQALNGRPILLTQKEPNPEETPYQVTTVTQLDFIAELPNRFTRVILPDCGSSNYTVMSLLPDDHPKITHYIQPPCNLSYIMQQLYKKGFSLSMAPYGEHLVDPTGYEFTVSAEFIRDTDDLVTRVESILNIHPKKLTDIGWMMDENDDWHLALSSKQERLDSMIKEQADKGRIWVRVTEEPETAYESTEIKSSEFNNIHPRFTRVMQISQRKCEFKVFSMIPIPIPMDGPVSILNLKRLCELVDLQAAANDSPYRFNLKPAPYLEQCLPGDLQYEHGFTAVSKLLTVVGRGPGHAGYDANQIFLALKDSEFRDSYTHLTYMYDNRTGDYLYFIGFASQTPTLKQQLQDKEQQINQLTAELTALRKKMEDIKTIVDT